MKIRVGVVYHWFAHYREPVIREMVKTMGDEFEFEFISDEISLEPAMKVMGARDFAAVTDPAPTFRRIRNIKLGHFIWQVGIFWRVFAGRYDTIVFLGEFRILSTWLAILVARLRGARTLFWSHGVYGNESWLKLRVRLTFYRLADAMLLYGNRSRILMESEGFSQKQLHVVFNSLDYRYQIEMRGKVHSNRQNYRTKHFPNNPYDPVLIFVGRLTKTKNLSLLIRVIQLLCDCLLYTSPSPRDQRGSRMPSSA